MKGAEEGVSHSFLLLHTGSASHLKPEFTTEGQMERDGQCYHSGVFLEQTGMVHALSSTGRAAAERQSEEERWLVLTAQGINSESSVSNCARLAFAE